MTTPWIAAFAVLSAAVALTLVVVTGVVRRALAILEEDSGASDPYARSLLVSRMYGGIPPGAAVPDFVARTAEGVTVTSDELLGHPVLCLFVAPGCAPCKMLLEDLRASRANLGAPLLVFGDELEDPKYAGLPATVTVVEQLDGSASQAFASTAFPQAFAVDAGVVRGLAIPNSLDDLRNLARTLGGGDRRPPVTETAAA